MIYTLPDAVDLPSGNGEPLLTLRLTCRDCAFCGTPGEAQAHKASTGHDVTYQGVSQHFDAPRFVLCEACKALRPVASVQIAYGRSLCLGCAREQAELRIAEEQQLFLSEGAD